MAQNPRKSARKSGQLQIRVSPAEKAAIARAARRAGMPVSAWVLDRLLPKAQERFVGLVRELSKSSEPGFVAAELNDLLDSLPTAEFQQAVAELPRAALTRYWQNYLAAMVEHAATAKRTESPPWTAQIDPLESPVFGTELKSLRLHLLLHSPPAFLRRNIFIDSSVGDRV